MKRFEFRLERVRRWRFEQAEIEEMRLKRLATELSQLDREEALLDAERAATERDLLAKTTLRSADFEALDSFRIWVKQCKANLARRRQECQERIARQRLQLVEARRNYRLLERLKERSLASWKAGLDRETENLAGELHLARWRPAGR